MAVLPIIIAPDPRLKKKCTPIEQVDDDITTLMAGELDKSDPLRLLFVRSLSRTDGLQATVRDRVNSRPPEDFSDTVPRS